MITTSKYYTGVIDIPNTKDVAPTSNLTGNKTLLDKIIETEEPEILINLLGYSLYSSFKGQFDISATTGEWALKPTAEQKYKDLLEGKTYNLNGEEVIYRGLSYKELNVYVSPLAFWNFCQFIKNDVTKYLSVGVKTLEGKHAVFASSNAKYTHAFRKFHELTQFKNKCYCDEIGNGTRSMYEFIQDTNNETPDTYPNWRPTHYPNENIYGV